MALPAAPDETPTVNSACLTAGTSTAATPVPGCGLSPPDVDGQGTLQLTPDAVGTEGGAFYDASFPTSDGLDIGFNAYQYGDGGGDGLSFDLAAVNPADPVAPADLGAPGGGLGYAPSQPSLNGLNDGYLGVGFDLFGNYSSANGDGTGCTDIAGITSNRGYDTVTVRGPGNATTGYSALTTTGLSGATLEGSTRADSQVPVEVALNPSSTTTTTSTGLVVPGGDYVVAFTAIGGTQQTLEGSLPSTLNGEIPSGLYPSSWINPTTGVPYQLDIGWAGSTGGVKDAHEIDANTVASTLGAPPAYSITDTDSDSGTLTLGTAASWTLPPRWLAPPTPLRRRSLTLSPSASRQPGHPAPGGPVCPIRPTPSRLSVPRRRPRSARGRSAPSR